jgi:Flp pilus assembly protein TadG
VKSNVSKPEKIPNGTPFSPERKTRGHAAVEVALMAPWIFLLFAMVFDLGFYSYAVIAAENAARSAVMYTSAATSTAADDSAACTVALRELRGMPNVSASTLCASTLGTISDARPLFVDACASGVACGGVQFTSVDGAAASRVVVTYRTPQLFPIPGLMGRMTVTRYAEARMRDN